MTCWIQSCTGTSRKEKLNQARIAGFQNSTTANRGPTQPLRAQQKKNLEEQGVRHPPHRLRFLLVERAGKVLRVGCLPMLPPVHPIDNFGDGTEYSVEVLCNSINRGLKYIGEDLI